MNNSDTPRTDENTWDSISGMYRCDSRAVKQAYVPADFARQLERELAAKERELEAHKAELKEYESIAEKIGAPKAISRLAALQSVARELARELANMKEWAVDQGHTDDTTQGYLDADKAVSDWSNLPPEVRGIDKS